MRSQSCHGRLCSPYATSCNTEAFRYFPSNGPPMMDQRYRGIDAPSTTDPIGAIQALPCGSMYRNSVKSVIVRPSGFHLVTGSPSKYPHLDSTGGDSSASETSAGSWSAAYATKAAIKAKNAND